MSELVSGLDASGIESELVEWDGRLELVVCEDGTETV